MDTKRKPAILGGFPLRQFLFGGFPSLQIQNQLQGMVPCGSPTKQVALMRVTGRNWKVGPAA